MCEYGIPFDHIETHWTDRQFAMFAERMAERLQAQAKAMKAAQRDTGWQDYH